MKLTEYPVLVSLASVAGIFDWDYKTPKTIKLEYDGPIPREQRIASFDLEVPLIKIGGSFSDVIKRVFRYMVSPFFQYQTGPLQLKDEKEFETLLEECDLLLNLIVQKVELAISKTQQRKQKENLTERPN